MIKSKSKYIGCAIYQNTDDEDDEDDEDDDEEGLKTYYIVCNYGPSDDYKNGEPYQPGPGVNKLQCDSDDCYKPYGYSCPSHHTY